ncbi:DgyrCDS13313 [Dimorphilus gyrociliatus]|uniref:DgyrCDS13313 n=1 Tax=Dimorphilus gyrociliatus TaxID=2664684 RepID=A0A7I8WA99_9ANNE|nr:DgyrCDS13313 [Dimorphilus gyrociliatus]
MTDFQTRTRIHGSGYSFTTIRNPCHSFHELYKERTQIHFRRPFPHDCRLDATRRYTDSSVFEAKVFSEGVRLTAKSCGQLARKEERQTGVSKLIYAVGGRPSALEGKFKFPKGLAVSPNTDIFVADSGNNRIQVLNQCGVFKYSFNEGLNQPSAIAVLPNNEPIVADRRNKRLRLFDEYGERKYDINLPYQPAEIVLLDVSNDLAISNQNGLVEIFDTETFNKKYSFRPNSTKIFQMATNNEGNLLIADSNAKVLTYSISSKSQVCQNKGRALKSTLTPKQFFIVMVKLALFFIFL